MNAAETNIVDYLPYYKNNIFSQNRRYAINVWHLHYLNISFSDT